jgi:hypothetical protein
MAKARKKKQRKTTPAMKIAPAKLWATPNEKRHKDVVGTVGAVLTGSPAVAYVAIARGNRAGGPMLALEQRATIRAGIAALRQAGRGYAATDPAKLHSGLVQGEKADAALVKAAGTGTNLASASAGMRRKVVKAGNGIATAAWGLRGLYVLASYAGFAAAQAAAAIGVNFIPIAGQIASAVIGAKAGIEGAVMAQANKDFQGMIKDGLARAGTPKPKADKAINTALAASLTEGGKAAPADVARAKSGPSVPLIVGGVVVAGIVVLLLVRRQR